MGWKGTPMVMQLCIVVPCYNEEDSIVSFVKAITNEIENIEQEIIQYNIVFVNDGSKDSTEKVIAKQIAKDPHLHCITFSRNFGKESALLAGMKKAIQLDATHVVIMDVDLQDPPSLIPKMIQRMDQTGCDVVATYRSTRQGEPPIRSWFAHRFYGLMSKLSDVEMRDGARDFRLMTINVVREIASLSENQRFSKGLFEWVGFDTEWIGYENVQRTTGSTHWSFISLVKYAIDGIVAFSVVPLIFISLIGMLLFVVSIGMLAFVIIRTLLFGDPVAGWPSLVCIITLLAGILLLSMGIVSIYLSKIYLEVKRRPIYIVKSEQ